MGKTPFFQKDGKMINGPDCTGNAELLKIT